MNFKPNAWTLLFALAIGVLLFNKYGVGETDIVAVDNCVSAMPDTISPEEAFDMLSNYSSYLANNQDIIDSLKDRTGGVENPNVIYFKIPKCELQQMVKSIPGGQVTAYLGVKPNPKSGKNMIDLFFSDRDMSNVDVNGGAEVFASKGAGERFWDFTKPCPTLCNE